jgi:outer membrane protein TolC
MAVEKWDGVFLGAFGLHWGPRRLRVFPLVFMGMPHELKTPTFPLDLLSYVTGRMSLLRSLILTLAALLAAAGRLAAGDPVSLTDALPEKLVPDLREVLEQGLEKGPSILMRRMEAEQSFQNARGARSSMLPQAYASVSGGVILEQRTNEGKAPVDDRLLEAVLYNVGINQPLFHWGALSKSYSVAKLHTAISARNLDETRRLLAIDLRRRYFDLVVAKGALLLEQKNIASLESELALAKKRVEQGIAASSESGVFEGKLIPARINLDRLKNDYDLLLRNFSRLSGLPLGKIPQPVAELPEVPKIEALIKGLTDAGGLPSTRLQNSEDIARIDRLNYEINKTRLKPKLGLSLSVNQDNRNPDNDALGPKALITSWNAFATVNWTIFDGFGAQAAQRSSLAKLRASEIDRDLARQQDAGDSFRKRRRVWPAPAAASRRLKKMWRQAGLRAARSTRRAGHSISRCSPPTSAGRSSIHCSRLIFPIADSIPRSSRRWRRRLKISPAPLFYVFDETFCDWRTPAGFGCGWLAGLPTDATGGRGGPHRARHRRACGSGEHPRDRGVSHGAEKRIRRSHHQEQHPARLGGEGG